MTSSTLLTLLALPAAVDRTTGSAFGMKKAMALMAVVALAILVVAALVGSARAKRKPPVPPTYPILDPPDGRPEDTPRTGPRP